MTINPKHQMPSNFIAYTMLPLNASNAAETAVAEHLLQFAHFFLN